MERVLLIGDLHLSDTNYGKHKDYANDCKVVMQNIASTIKGDVAKNGKYEQIVILGDFADKRFIDLSFRNAVDKWLTALNSVSNHLYCLVGNHDECGGVTTELEYYTERGLIEKHPLDAKVGGLNVHYVDFIREKEDMIKAHETDAEIIVTHNAVSASEVTIMDTVDLSTLNAPNLKLVVMGHIHDENYFAAKGKSGTIKVLDGGASCIKSVDRKDAKGFNMICLKFPGEGKLQCEKLYVEYPKDAFVEKTASSTDEAEEKWNSTDITVDFGINGGSGTLELDDLLKNLSENNVEEEIVATVKKLFERYADTDITETGGTVESDEEDLAINDILNVFTSAIPESVTVADDSNTDGNTDDILTDLDSDDTDDASVEELLFEIEDFD